MSAKITQFPVPKKHPSIMQGQELDALFDAFNEYRTLISDQLGLLQSDFEKNKDGTKPANLTNGQYHLLLSSLLTHILVQDHRAAVLEQAIGSLNDYVYGGEE